jgi:hypothetical protein
MNAFDESGLMTTAPMDTYVPATGAGFTQTDFALLDRRYSAGIAALSSPKALAALGFGPEASTEILAILKEDPEVFSDMTNGHLSRSDDLTVDETTHYNVETSNQTPSEQTASFVERFHLFHQQFVYDNATWVSGFNPESFERHTKRAAKNRRYHGIEAEVLDAAGRVKSVRHLTSAVPAN